MKGKLILPLVLTVLLCFGGCAPKQDAGILFREAKSNAEGLKSCTATLTNTLQFAANGKKHAFQSSSQVLFHASPFAVKSIQSVKSDGTSSSQETYTVTQDGGLWFYCKNGGVWQKTGAQNLDTSPESQIDILRVLNTVSGEKYVRETDLNGRKVHKLELDFSSEILRSPIETIVSSTGMAKDSKTIVQTLIDSAPTVYGYGYVDAETGQLVRVECDLADELNSIFQKIDGGSITVQVEKSSISGDIGTIGSAPSVVLPEEAKEASSVEASG